MESFKFLFILMILCFSVVNTFSQDTMIVEDDTIVIFSQQPDVQIDQSELEALKTQKNNLIEEVRSRQTTIRVLALFLTVFVILFIIFLFAFLSVRKKRKADQIEFIEELSKKSERKE